MPITSARRPRPHHQHKPAALFPHILRSLTNHVLLLTSYVVHCLIHQVSVCDDFVMFVSLFNFVSFFMQEYVYEFNFACNFSVVLLHGYPLWSSDALYMSESHEGVKTLDRPH